MTIQTLKIGKREFVVVPRRDFERIRAQAERQAQSDREEAGDVAESRRRRVRGTPKPYAALRVKLGLR